ncbi:MAG: hypothetical protein WC637_03145 [Victivallales bacterium]
MKLQPAVRWLTKAGINSHVRNCSASFSLQQGRSLTSCPTAPAKRHIT